MKADVDTEENPDPPQLWAIVKYYLNFLLGFFDPPAFLRAAAIKPGECAFLLSWLRPIEAIVRKLLLIDAAALPKPVRGSTRTTRRSACKRRIVTLDPDDSLAWPVRFAIAPPASAARKRRLSRASQARAPRSPWPLAERFEAVLRVVADPAPYAARLARRLHRSFALAQRLAKPPPPRPRGAPWRTGAWELDHAARHAQHALAAFADSS